MRKQEGKGGFKLVFIFFIVQSYEWIKIIIQIQLKIKMDKLTNIRHVTSPLQGSTSQNFNFESRESVVVGRTNFGIEPTKLDFKTSKV